MNPTLNVHTIIPRSFIHCRAKRAGSFGECLKVALHSVVAPTDVLILEQEFSAFVSLFHFRTRYIFDNCH